MSEKYIDMRITHLRVENFKSLVGFNLSLAKFNCLVGLNGSGKSTVLRINPDSQCNAIAPSMFSVIAFVICPRGRVYLLLDEIRNDSRKTRPYRRIMARLEH